MTLTNFLLHFKTKCLQRPAARFEPIHISIHTKDFTTRSLVHAWVAIGKQMTLTNFLLHFKTKCLQRPAARFEPIHVSIHTKDSTTRPLVHACVAIGKQMTLPTFYFILRQNACNGPQRDLNQYTYQFTPKASPLDHSFMLA